MARGGGQSGSKLDRELIELLNELRVALPGVQVLFAFLLTVPFTQRFATVTEFQRDLYFGVLLCTALAAVLLIAPSAYHRILFREHDKPKIISDSNRLTIAGLFSLALAMTGAVTLISDLLFGTTFTLVVTVLTGLAFLGTWYALPFARGDRG